MEISQATINRKYDQYLLNICKDWERGLMIEQELVERITVTNAERKMSLCQYIRLCKDMGIDPTN